jgi:EmrB/QacA subfamily drug resistance transporter
MAHRRYVPTGSAALRVLPFDKPCPEKARPWVLTATILASALAFIDMMVVGIAVPVIQADFAAELSQMQWVVNAYMLVLGALILVGGGLGDRVGRRLIFVIGIAVFAVASLICAIAPNVSILIAGRAIQGIGAALLVPQSLAIIAANFPPDIRGKAIGTWAAASAVTTALGPPLGGLLIDFLSWRWAFWINLPLSAVAVWLTLQFVPESRDPKATGPIDWTGTVLAILAFGALTYGFTAISEAGASRTAITAAIVAGLVLLVAFVTVERRATNPVMPPDLFKSRVFTVVNIVTVFLYGALSAALFLLPFDLLARRGMTAAEAGIILLPFGIIIGALSRYSGGLADKYGPRIFLIFGPILVGLGCVGFATGVDQIWIGVVVPIVLVSVGMGFVASPLTTAVMNAAPSERSGAASGINNTSDRLAGVLAVAIFGAIASVVYLGGVKEGSFGVLPVMDAPSRPAAEAAFLSGYMWAMLFAAFWCFIASVLAFFGLPKNKQGAMAEAGAA